MAYLPVPVDDNGWKLTDLASEPIPARITLTETFSAVRFAADIKGLAILVSSGTLVMKGTSPGNVISLNNAAVVNNGDGTVTVGATGHLLTDGDEFVIPVGQSTNYAGTHTVLAAGDANSLVFTHAFTAETIASGAYAFGYVYPQFATGTVLAIPVCKKDPAALNTNGTPYGLQTVFNGKALSGTCTLECLTWR